MKTFSFLSLLIFLSSCASYHGKKEYQEIGDFFYTALEDERQMGRAYVPKGDGPFPGVILVHGGGWKSRDLEDMRTIARTLASRGFSVFSINYRFPPEYLHPSPINDLQQALIYFKGQADKFKLKKDKIGLWGYSSGAHTSAYFALTRAKDAALRVQAVVAGGGPYDLTKYPDSPLVSGYMGAKRDKMPEQYREASCLSHVSSASPPFYLYHGVNDLLVKHQQMTEFAEILLANKVKVQRHDVKFWGHAGTFIFSAEAVKQGVKFLREELK